MLILHGRSSYSCIVSADLITEHNSNYSEGEETENCRQQRQDEMVVKVFLFCMWNKHRSRDTVQ